MRLEHPETAKDAADGAVSQAQRDIHAESSVTSSDPAKYDFRALRKRSGLNQADWAERMGLSPRSYFAIEHDGAASDRHVMLAELAALELAIEREDPSLVPERIARLARAFAALPGQ